jgi:8-oxo-dGTP pyrophosphatase MutT (NUDIX family)
MPADPPEPIARFRPNRIRPGVPALDRIVDGMARADAEMEQVVVERDVVYSGRILTAERDVARTAGGDLVTRDVVIHPGAVVVAPLDDRGRLVMVTQYRLPAGGTLLELPAGTLDIHDGAVEDPLDAAHRELEEETGFRAGSMERIGGYWSAPGFSTEYLTLYLATDLREAGADRRSPDADEELGVVALPLADAVAAVEAGLIEDAKSIAGILLVARRIERA